MRSDEAPLVTVGIPVFNGEKYLREAIESVLAQEGVSFELVLADNASTDGTRDICREYAKRDARVRYHRSGENVGLNRNFKRAVKLAQGSYFTWLAHDDSLGCPRYLAEHVRYLEAHPDVMLCGCSMRVFEAENPGMATEYPMESVLPDRDWRQARLEFFRWPQPGFHGLLIYGVYRRAALLRVPLEGRLHHGNDVAVDMEYPILANLCRFGRIVALPQVMRNSRSVSDSAACREMERFSTFDYLRLALGTRLKILRIGLRMPLPFREKCALLKLVLGNFGRAHLGQRPRFTSCLKALRQEVAALRKEVAMLHGVCEDRLRLIEDLEMKVKDQRDWTLHLERELKEAQAPNEVS